MKEAVDHPSHYGGKENPYETIKVIEAWDLGFRLGYAVKYISRAGKKDPDRALEDLRKALWYLEREISALGKVKPKRCICGVTCGAYGCQSCGSSGKKCLHCGGMT